MNELKVFKFENEAIRTLSINGEPYFVGKDVAEILGYSNASKAVMNHVDLDDKKFEMVAHSQNGNLSETKTAVINESGLYSLILKSKLPNAKKFKRWVTSEVLPTIRKHGGYLTPDKLQEALMDPDTIIQLAMSLKSEREKNMLLEQQISEYEPRINYLDIILSSKDTVTVTQIAADYGRSAIEFNKLLNELGVQHKVSGQWILYRKHMQQGYVKSQTTNITLANGENKAVMNTKWTQKGRLFLYDLLKANGYFPQLDLELE